MTEKRLDDGVVSKVNEEELVYVDKKELEELIDRHDHLKKENEQLKQKLQIHKSDELETLNDLQRCYENAKKSMKRMDILEEENEQLKQEVTHWKKILDNHQQIVAKTLREQYHWLKNEDKISNPDKTVALLELESISARLGIDLN